MAALCLLSSFAGCGRKSDQESVSDAGAVSAAAMEGAQQDEQGGKKSVQVKQKKWKSYGANTQIQEVINDPVFGDYGRMIFPVDSGYYSGNTLGNLRLTWSAILTRI